MRRNNSSKKTSAFKDFFATRNNNKSHCGNLVADAEKSLRLLRILPDAFSLRRYFPGVAVEPFISKAMSENPRREEWRRH